MQTKSKFTLVAAVLAASVAMPTAAALACDPPRSVAAERRDAAKREAARREADASRVADWLAQRILNDLAQDDAELVDISAEEVRAATGVDATRLDLDRLREQVAAKMLAIGPSESRSVVPTPRPTPAAKAAPAAPPAKSAPSHKAKSPVGKTAKAAKPDASRGGGSSARRATEDSSCGRTFMRR